MTEIFKPVLSYEKLYLVSDLGRVISLEKVIIDSNGNKYRYKEKVLSGHVTSAGYVRVCLTKDKVRKNYLVHQIVAKSFLSNLECKPHINHIDANKLNNSVKNLEWCTVQENNKHAKDNKLCAHGEGHFRSKLVSSDIAVILNMRNKLTIREIGKKFGVSGTTIFAIFSGRTWEKEVSAYWEKEFFAKARLAP
jgi:hypothetical protein